MNVAIEQRSTGREIRGWLILGFLGAIFFAVGIGGWAAKTKIAGAVTATGHLIVDSDVKKVQHPTGGVITQLKVQEGSRVHVGDVLIRLDDTATRANLGVIDKSLVELTARQARGQAERDGAEQVSFPRELTSRAAEPDVANAMRGEERFFNLRRAAREGQKAQLRERIDQLQIEMRGVAEQLKAKDAESGLITKELDGVRRLWEQNLTPIMRLTALERDAAKNTGERGALVAAQAQAKGKISEIQLQILQIDQNLSAEVGKELGDIRSQIAELSEKRLAALDQLNRVDIRAPLDGTVHELSAHTVGGVIAAGEQIMLIVPSHDDLMVEANVSPQEIDRVWIGQEALLRFTSFDRATTPEITGQVALVSADVSQDPKTGAPFYSVRIAIPAAERAHLGDVKLMPGMPVETFIQTGDRSVASYLAKPLLDHLKAAWRER